MFTTLAVLSLVAFLFITLAVPFYFKAMASELLEKIRSWALARSSRALFSASDALGWERLVNARIWCVAAVVMTGAFLLKAETAFTNTPMGTASVWLSLIGGWISAVVLAVGTHAAQHYLPLLRGAALLGRFGFRGLWVLDPGASAQELREGMLARLRASGRIAIVDVTGHELIGKGGGPNGGLLFDTISAMTSVPVQLLLLQPETFNPDPEQRRATIFQSVLAEMDISPQNYVRRIRATLDAISTLNEARPDDAKIEVRFYNEKPSFRAIVFDECLFASPWVARETTTATPFLEIDREAAEPTLYNAFRFHCARLWIASAPKHEAAIRAQGFKSVAFRRDGQQAPAAAR